MSVILVILLFLGWQPAAKNARGNELYQQEKYDEALAAYDDALAEDDENPVLHYNRGNALYRSERYPSAVQSYTNALDDEATLGGRARYNLGNSLYRMGRLKESIEAYKEGLRVRPGRYRHEIQPGIRDATASGAGGTGTPERAEPAGRPG